MVTTCTPCDSRKAIEEEFASRPRRILVLSPGFPSRVQPEHGVFVKERVRFVAELPGVEVCVVSPGPYFPPIKWFKRWYPLSQIPRTEVIDGLQVVRPRYFMPPVLGGYLESRLMYTAAKRALKRVRRSFDFDLIDAHRAYPSGAVALRLGALYRKPVVITGRGEDIECFPSLPLIGGQVRDALRGATQLIAVSQRIAEAMERHGADPRKITVIANGVDCEKFRLLPQKEARRQLGLHANCRVIVAVGYRLELKGFHILIDAMRRILASVPDAILVIVGGGARWAPDFLPVLEERVRVHQLNGRVLLVGARPQEELSTWYSAADVLAILSSREGSPNVLMEALACGLPAVATRVGGIPEVLSDPRFGLLLPERSAEAAAAGILDALARSWDRGLIRRFAEEHSWHQTALQVNEVFERAVAEYSSSRGN